MSATATDSAVQSAADLLAIPADAPERLYPGEAVAAKAVFRKLAMRWHPDHSDDPQANEVLTHVKALYEQALEKIAAGTWITPGLLRFTTTDDRTFEIKYQRRHTFELGAMYVASSVVAFVIDRSHADLVQRAERTIQGFTYANEAMREQFAPRIPAYPFAGAFETASSQIIVMRKTPDVLLLRDVLDHFGARMDSRHVAWVISRLLNLCCYFQHAGITHNALSIDTCFISPPYHSVLVLGGWWYATRAGERMVAAPAKTVEWAPHDLLAKKLGSIRTDLELVRAVGRELLGDISGVRLARDKAAKQAMIDWLRLPASDDPVEEFRIWNTQVLQHSFGARRFVELPLTQSDIYR